MAELNNEQVIEKVMNVIEEFYFDEGPESGEAIFNEFAAEHAAKFPDDFDADTAENKLEYTEVFQ